MDDSLDKSGNRVVVILDVRNVECRHSQQYTNTVIEYGKLLKDTVRGRNCVAAYAVDGVTYEDGKDVCALFHEELKNAGFEPVLVPASNNMGKQGGVDIKIALVAHDAVLKGECDCIELITGDGDFGVLVEELQNKGAEMNVTSFRSNLSYMLRGMADNCRILDTMPLIRMRNELKEGI